MKLDIKGKHGAGAFADVFRAEDELGRDVAVRIVRPSGLPVESALDHARLLAKANHPNIVKVLCVETLPDPVSQAMVDCVVMEFIEGPTLSERMRGVALSIPEATAIGSGILDGVEYLHSIGAAHGDLHTDNILLDSGKAKIIDILFQETATQVTTRSLEARTSGDISSLRFILQQVLMHSALEFGAATAFGEIQHNGLTLANLRRAFEEATTTSLGEDAEQHLSYVVNIVMDEAFVEGKEYSVAVSEEVRDTEVGPVLEKLLDEKAATKNHYSLLAVLWSRLDLPQRNALAHRLDQAIRENTPKGTWWPYLRMLQGFGEDGWNRMSKVGRLRLESVLVNDMLSGTTVVKNPKLGKRGILGTWTNVFWPYFRDRDSLVQSIAMMLRQDIGTQNYIGKHFLNEIPSIADTDERKEELILALAHAYVAGATMVKNGIVFLPKDWQKEVQLKAKALSDLNLDDIPF